MRFAVLPMRQNEQLADIGREYMEKLGYGGQPYVVFNLTQGMFVGAVADNFEERIEQKIFHAEIVVDNAKVAAETKRYKQIPVITGFVDENGIDRMKEQIQENYNRIKAETKQIVAEELERIKSDPELCKLLPKQEE